MGLSLFIFCGGLWKTHLFYSRVRIGPSSSSKVVDFGTNRKGVCDFLLVINSNFCPILHRFWDTRTYRLKSAKNFPRSHSHLTPSLGVNPFEFLVNFISPKLESLGYPSVKISWSHRASFDTVPACDREIDRQTYTVKLDRILIQGSA